MTDRKISNFEFGSLNYFLTRAFLVGFTFNILLNILEQNSWIIPILSIIPAFIIIYSINYVINYRPDLSIGKKIINIFPKKVGVFIIIITTLCIYLISILNYLNLNNFIQSQFLNRTPLISISIMFMIATYYILTKGLNTITRTSNILFYIAFSLFILSFLGLLPVIKFDNLKPFFTLSSFDYLNALNSFYAFNILPMFLITVIPKNKLNNPKIKKTLIISYIVSITSIFFVIFQTIGTFGYELSLLYEYPEFFALKHVVLVELASRVESVLIIQMILDIFIFNLFSIYFMSDNIKSVIGNKGSNAIYLFLCSLMVIGTIFISKYNIYIDNIISNIVPIAMNIFFTTLIILICFKIKMSK